MHKYYIGSQSFLDELKKTESLKTCFKKHFFSVQVSAKHLIDQAIIGFYEEHMSKKVATLKFCY